MSASRFWFGMFAGVLLLLVPLMYLAASKSEFRDACKARGGHPAHMRNGWLCIDPKMIR